MSALSDDVKRLLVALGSVEALEALLLLARTPERSFSYGQVASKLHVTRGVEAALERLASLNLADVRLASTVRYRYAPTSPALAATVDELAREYASRRLLVLGALDRRASMSPISAFADAFRLNPRSNEQPPKDNEDDEDETEREGGRDSRTGKKGEKKGDG